MKLRFYAVKDVLVGSFQNPQPLNNDEVAKRSLSIISHEKDKYYKENWKDIELHYLFTLDTDTGLIVENSPYCVGRLVDYVNKIDLGGNDGENS